MKVFYEEFELKTKKKAIDQHIANILSDNHIDEDDKGSIEIEVFFGKKVVTVKIYDRTLN